MIGTHLECFPLLSVAYCCVTNHPKVSGVKHIFYYVSDSVGLILDRA